MYQENHMIRSTDGDLHVFHFREMMLWYFTYNKPRWPHPDRGVRKALITNSLSLHTSLNAVLTSWQCLAIDALNVSLTCPHNWKVDFIFWVLHQAKGNQWFWLHCDRNARCQCCWTIGAAATRSCRQKMRRCNLCLSVIASGLNMVRVLVHAKQIHFCHTVVIHSFSLPEFNHFHVHPFNVISREPGRR